MNASSEHRHTVSSGRLQNHGKGIGIPAKELIERRSKEIARIEGHDPDMFAEEDRLRAEKELSDQSLVLSAEEYSSSLSASSNPADIAVDTGHENAGIQPADEQELQEKEIKEGVREAEHERMLDSRR